MNQLIKKVCVLCGVSFLLFVVYYGNFLSLKKSQDFIATIQRLDSIRSLPDFESKFSQALDIPSHRAGGIGAEYG